MKNIRKLDNITPSNPFLLLYLLLFQNLNVVICFLLMFEMYIVWVYMWCNHHVGMSPRLQGLAHGSKHLIRTHIRSNDCLNFHVLKWLVRLNIVSLILAFQLELIPIFFHMDSIKEFQISIQSWRSTTIVVIVIGVRGIRDNKTFKILLIAEEEGEFDQDVFILHNDFKIEYDQLLEAYNGGQCAMLLIKNVTTTSKGVRYLKA